MTAGTNWAGNYVYQATRLHEPGSIDELRSIVSRADRIHALGTRHSFNGVSDSAELVSLSKLIEEVQIDPELRTVSVSAAMRYGDLAQELERAGYALHNMASLPHISVGGAIALSRVGWARASVKRDAGEE